MVEYIFLTVYLLVIVVSFVSIYLQLQKNHREVEHIKYVVDEYLRIMNDYIKVMTEYSEYIKSLTQIKE